jgi:hypothetical protein
METKKQPCPCCKGTDLYYDSYGASYWVGCVECGKYGQSADTINKAIDLWNALPEEPTVQGS